MDLNDSVRSTDSPLLASVEPPMLRAVQKQLGAFYTPSTLSDILVDWAVQVEEDTILEPGFGGCGFIESAINRLRGLGCATPDQQIFGCDIDPGAFSILRRTLSPAVIQTHFVQRDFLTCRPDTTWPIRFTAVVGNPPYVSYQALGARARESHQRVLHELGFGDVSARASLWAYFVLHATTFLQTGGRMAWVLPGSFLQAHYAQPVRAHLASLFRRIFVARVHERLFVKVGADEETVVLLADGYGQADLAAPHSAYRQIDTLAQLRESIQGWSSASNEIGGIINEPLEAARSISFNCIPRPRMPIATRTLGSLVRVKIGLVTGDNPFFVLSSDEAQARGLNVHSLQPILSKFSMAIGAILTKKDMRHAVDNCARGWLVSVPKYPSGIASIDRYLESYPASKLASVGTFRKRSVWHRIDDGRPPDAFWPVMRDQGPTIVINRAKVNCTNTVHRVYALPETKSEELSLVLLGVISTFGQLSAECVGRHYGSGVLKHEPREVEAIDIPWVADARITDVKAVVDQVDQCLRRGRLTMARNAADQFFIDNLQHCTRNYVRSLRATLVEVRRKRMPRTREIMRTSNQPKHF